MTFPWPWQYSFPPFYTLQPNIETEKKQLEAWRTLVLDYCRFHKIYVLDVQEASTSPLFQNKSIDRQLSIEGVTRVLEGLREQNRIEWIDKTRKRCLVYWRTPEEWGDLIYRYISESGLTNTVCTLFELTSGDDTKNQEFSGLDQAVLIKALKALEAQKRAELIMFDGNEGVKFF